MNNKGWIKYLVTTAVGIAIAFLVLQVRGVWYETNNKEIIEILCDAFTVSGILLLCFGALLFCSSQGVFDGLTYVFHLLFVVHNWSKTNFKDRQTYREYVEEKRTKREKEVKLYFVSIVGAVFFAIALIFLAIYSNM